MDLQYSPQAEPGTTAEREGIQKVTGTNLAGGSGEVVDPHLRLRSVNHLQQLLKDHADSWGVLWALEGMKRQNHDAVVVNFSGVSRASVWSSWGTATVLSGGMNRCATAYRVPTRSRIAKKLQTLLPTLEVCGAA